MKSRKCPKKKVSQPPHRPVIEIVERDPDGPVDLEDFKRKASPYWERAARMAQRPHRD